MGAASQGGQMNPQGAQIRPQGQQQSPMGGQGKGPGLPMPQQGGDRPFQSQPYQPVGVNNPPFNPNPVQNTPGNMPVGMGQAKGAGQGQMTPQMMDQMKQIYQAQPQQPQMQQLQQMLQGGYQPQQLASEPVKYSNPIQKFMAPHTQPRPEIKNQGTPYNGPRNQPMPRPQVQQPMPQSGKGPGQGLSPQQIQALQPMMQQQTQQGFGQVDPSMAQNIGNLGSSIGQGFM